MFHVATMMGPESTRSETTTNSSSSSSSADRAVSMSKKRHIGNDFVHVVYKVRLLTCVCRTWSRC